MQSPRGGKASAPLTWKGVMQSWSLQCRTPGLCCKLLAKARTPAAFFGFARRTKKGHPRKKASSGSLRGSGDSPSSLLPPPSPPPHQQRNSTGSCQDRPAGKPRRSSSDGSAKATLEHRKSDSKIIRLGHPSSSPSTSSVGSPSLHLSSKLKGIASAAQNNLAELVSGNQFLTHVTAAPVKGGRRSADLAPSVGLTSGPRRHSDADLRDRIIFFA